VASEIYYVPEVLARIFPTAASFSLEAKSPI